MSVMLDTATLPIGDLALSGGQVLRDARLAVATAGRLSSARDNAILVTHGFTSSHLFIGRAGSQAAEGSWARLVGPGAAIDTDRFFVVSSNMLGSSYGSTAPASLNPVTGAPYGPDFPDITLSDIVAAQRAMLATMGIERLVAVVGPSYGGFQAFTWAIDHPDAMRGISASVSGLTAPADVTEAGLLARFTADPNWNGGHYYSRGGMLETMTALRRQTLYDYGVDESLMEAIPDPAARAAAITAQARAWAQGFDANAMLVLARAMHRYDARPHLARIRARVQYVLSRTDKLFPPSLAAPTMAALRAAGVRAEYAEIDSEFGHHAAGTDWAKWQGELRRFLAGLA